MKLLRRDGKAFGLQMRDDNAILCNLASNFSACLTRKELRGFFIGFFRLPNGLWEHFLSLRLSGVGHIVMGVTVWAQCIPRRFMTIMKCHFWPTSFCFHLRVEEGMSSQNRSTGMREAGTPLFGSQNPILLRLIVSCSKVRCRGWFRNSLGIWQAGSKVGVRQLALISFLFRNY
jgi:hypothetical protein